MTPDHPSYQEALEVAENNERFIRAFTPLVDAGMNHATAAREFVAPWVARVESGGALSSEEILRSMPAAKRARLHLALAADVHRLVSTLDGQRTRYVKFLAGTATEEDGREAEAEWAVVFDRASHLSLAEYSPAVTGAALELKYRVEDDSGTHAFDFDGFAEGNLQWVVAELDSHFPNVSLVDPSQVVNTVAMDFMLSAARQVRASRGYPIRWCVQSPFDAQRLRNLLTAGGFTQITVDHVSGR